MAESTLSIAYEELRSIVSFAMGYGWAEDAAAWANLTTAQQNEIDRAIREGLRQFYRPVPLAGERQAHEWSFIRIVTTLSAPANVPASGTDGVVAANGTDLTAAGITDWTVYGMTAADYQVVITDAVGVGADGTYAVASIAAAKLVIADAGGAITSCTYSVERINSGCYDLPDDFAGMESPLTFEPEEAYVPVKIVSEVRIRAYWQRHTETTYPRWAAIRARSCDGSAGQRYEILFAPLLDDLYVLEYQYLALLSSLTTGNPYPLGGADHADTIIKSCLAAAERFVNGERGVEYEAFMEALAASVYRDRQAHTPHSLGIHSPGSGLHRRRVTGITYNGVDIDTI